MVVSLASLSNEFLWWKCVCGPLGMLVQTLRLVVCEVKIAAGFGELEFLEGDFDIECPGKGVKDTQSDNKYWKPLLTQPIQGKIDIHMF